MAAPGSALNTGLTNTSVAALAIDPKTPTTLYAGTNGGGVFAIEQITCVGDCNGDGEVTVNELVAMVNSALGPRRRLACAGDANGDGQITINEIVAGVNNALNGCGVG